VCGLGAHRAVRADQRRRRPRAAHRFAAGVADPRRRQHADRLLDVLLRRRDLAASQSWSAAAAAGRRAAAARAAGRRQRGPGPGLARGTDRHLDGALGALCRLAARRETPQAPVAKSREDAMSLIKPFAVALLAAVLSAPAAQAQSSRNIKIVVPYPPGSGPD